MTDAIPRMYYLFPELAGDAAALGSSLDSCAAMGFKQIVVPAPARPGTDREGTAGADAAGQAHSVAVTTLATACDARGLALIIDFDPGAGAAALAELVPAGQGRPDTLPDPRSRPLEPSLAMEDGVSGQSDEAYWIATLQAWSSAGAVGFCCRGLARRPPGFWQRLIAAIRTRNPAARFFAWTPGSTPTQLAALVGCGFDATFASTAWWDYRADWLAEEAARLASVAPAIALVDDPLNPLLARDRLPGSDEAVRRQYLRALATAAATGVGMLMPMGFEHGLSGMHDAATGATVDVSGDATPLAQIDLRAAVTAANALLTRLGDAGGTAFTTLSAASSGTTALLRRVRAGDAPAEAVMVLINADARATASADLARLASRTGGLLARERLWPDDGVSLAEDERQVLQPAEVQVFALGRPPVVMTPAPRGKRSVDAACKAPRIAIEAVAPAVDGGRFPVKRTVGETIDIEADVFMDGHDKLGVALLWRTADTATWQELPMPFLVNDRWRAALPLRRVGRHQFVVQAWRDAFATYRDELTKKSAAGLDVTLELEEGRQLIEAAAAHAALKDLAHAAIALATLTELLASKPEASGDRDPAAHRARLVAAVLADDTLQAMREADDRPFAVLSAPISIDAERMAARFSSWYELFPRSQSGDPDRHGTFADVEQRLPAIRDMGFDTLYFTPIHPIGKTNRKGRNNSLTPTPDDPGSPYAIGSPEGGHDAIHPELGTLEDFRRLCRAARDNGLEIALDFAIQCSPDHPWIKDHPDWFAWRPDGTMRYAENPPKRYEDIVNVDFYAEGAMPALWLALRDAVLLWVKEGVRVFRVDNPHTKPLPFWEWMIGDIRGRFPDTIFLSEAFTRPKVMYRLAKVGFSQSYTYFTWRHTKAEFTEYLTELSTTAVRDFFRPHFFVNTPDINPVFLQKSGRPGFLIRAALATMLSGLWGMYSGFELCEGTPVPDKEDYLNSEKYEVRAWDWQRPGNIIAEITALNRIRRMHPALQTHLGIRFCDASDPNILCFIKSTPPLAGDDRLGDDVVFVAINLDPFAAHQTSITLPLWQFGLPHDGTLAVRDLVHGNDFELRGAHHQLRLDPLALPYAIWHLQHSEPRT